MKIHPLVSGNLKFICFLILLLWSQMTATGYSFVRVNSGTKSDITHLSMVNAEDGFFLADKLYSLNKNNSWTKANYPDEHTISQFSALAADDFWYSCNFNNSTGEFDGAVWRLNLFYVRPSRQYGLCRKFL